MSNHAPGPTTEAKSRPRQQWALVGYFLALIVAVPVIQLASELLRREPVQELDVFRQFPTLERIEAYERALEDNSVVAEATRKHCQWMGLWALRAGNREALMARERAMFYRTSLDSVTAPGFMDDPTTEGHPLPAIVAFRDTLQRQEVELLLLMVPGKEQIHPEWLSRRGAKLQSPPANSDMPAFLAELDRAGVRCIDATPLLWNAKGPSGDMYLRRDTHWTPEGLELVADRLAEEVAEFAGESHFESQGETVQNRGDLFDMLDLPGLPTSCKPQTTTVNRVIDTDTGQPVEPDVDSPVVLLGDSFTNVYSVGDMGWGDSAGLGEQLALRLGQPIDVIAQDDGGVNTARATLARSGSLAGKRLVIWQFAARDLVVSNGEWKRIEVASPQEG